ncbi:MAG: hypothetical protein PHG02_03125, partial [Oscillospiraceae bacterium]|nr:hypothetical protein [Oscillospiraceae bacterium]
VSAVTDVSTGCSSLGIIRYQNIYESYFLNLLHENNLQYEVLWEYPMCVLMSENHPLAALSDIPYHLLLQYTEISHGDFQVPALPPSQTKKLAAVNPSANRIFVYDRGSQFDLLQRVAGTYLWVSPVPYEELSKHNLVQKPCSVAGINKDIVIYHNRDELQTHEKEFIDTLRLVIKTELQIFTPAKTFIKKQL